MIYDLQSLLDYIVVIFISFALFYLAYRKYFANIYDPFFFDVVVNLSFSSSLMFIVNVNKPFYLLEFIFFQCFFYLGFRVFYSSPKGWVASIPNEKNIFSRRSIKVLSLLTLTAFLIVVASNIVIFYKTGFAVFSKEPTAAKVDNFTDGMGVFRRLLWSLGALPIIGSLILIYSRHKPILFAFVLMTLFVLAITSGSKSALLPFVFYIFLLATHSNFKNNATALKFKKTLPVVFSLALVAAVFILVVEKGRVGDAIYALLNRLLYNGDAVFYYYHSSVLAYFSTYNLLTYVYNVTNSILGMLRLVPYEQPTGYQMLYEYYSGDLPFTTTLGPNTPFYIAADMYFGFFFGTFYSFLIGAMIAKTRIAFQKVRRNAIILMAFTWLYVSCFTLIIEAQLFVGRLFDMVVFLSPVIVFVLLIYYGVKPIRHKRWQCDERNIKKGGAACL